MGSSTISVQAVFDRVRVKGIPTPLTQPVGYDVDAAIATANDVMADLIAERFNWKFNRKSGQPFYTNSYQQDYPQVGIADIGWLEDADRIDINNTAIPKPLRPINVRRQLSRTSRLWTPIDSVCWMYNGDLSYGNWPGPGVTFYPLIAATVQQNPVMSFIDTNGNFLILTQFGVTGPSQPSLPASSPEGTILSDGTCEWTCVASTSQGFRVFPLPGGSGPVWEIIPYYQMRRPTIASLQTMINPIPDDYSQHFQRGIEAYCLMGSPNPADRPRGQQAKLDWLKSMSDARNQGNREQDAYALLPATSPVDVTYGRGGLRNPQDPSEPY